MSPRSFGRPSCAVAAARAAAIALAALAIAPPAFAASPDFSVFLPFQGIGSGESQGRLVPGPEGLPCGTFNRMTVGAGTFGAVYPLERDGRLTFVPSFEATLGVQGEQMAVAMADGRSGERAILAARQRAEGTGQVVPGRIEIEAPLDAGPAALGGPHREGVDPLEALSGAPAKHRAHAGETVRATASAGGGSVPPTVAAGQEGPGRVAAIDPAMEGMQQFEFARDGWRVEHAPEGSRPGERGSVEATVPTEGHTVRALAVEMAERMQDLELAQDARGRIHGATPLGAAGFGTVLRLPGRRPVEALHTFTGGADGGMPVTGPARARARAPERDALHAFPRRQARVRPRRGPLPRRVTRIRKTSRQAAWPRLRSGTWR